MQLSITEGMLLFFLITTFHIMEILDVETTKKDQEKYVLLTNLYYKTYIPAIFEWS